MNILALLRGWSFVRWLRLIMGIAIALQAVETKDLFIGILAALLLYQAIANVGCCGVNSCSTPTTSGNQKLQSQEPEYEEVK